MLTVKITLTCDICRSLIESVETENTSEYRFTSNVINLSHKSNESITVVSTYKDLGENKDCPPYLHGWSLDLCPLCLQKIYSGKQVFEWKDHQLGEVVHSFQLGKREFEL